MRTDINISGAGTHVAVYADVIQSDQFGFANMAFVLDGQQAGVYNSTGGAEHTSRTWNWLLWESADDLSDTEHTLQISVDSIAGIGGYLAGIDYIVYTPSEPSPPGCVQALSSNSESI